MRRITTDSGPPWRLACEKCLRPSVSRNCGVNTPVIGSRIALVCTASRLTATSSFACTRRSRLSMRASTSGASAVLPMKSLAPESRARFLVVSFSSPEITTTGICLMRASPLPRMRAEQAEAVELGHRQVGEHHHDRLVGLHRDPAGLAVGFLAHREVRLQDALERGAHELRVVDQEHRALRDVAGGRHAIYSDRSTTIRRLILALMKSSNTPGSSANGMVRAISLSSGGLRSLASRRPDRFADVRSSCRPS